MLIHRYIHFINPQILDLAFNLEAGPRLDFDIRFPDKPENE